MLDDYNISQTNVSIMNLKVCFIIYLLWICPNALHYGSIIAPESDPIIEEKEELSICLPDLSDFQQQASALDLSIPLDFNYEVYDALNHYMNRQKRILPRLMARQDHFSPMMLEIANEMETPKELIYLSIVESGLNLRANSHAGAAGLWQLMPATAKELGLERDEYHDERFDPQMSTRAAFKYLNRLKSYYSGDWLLALAAYNCGMGTVDLAMSVECGDQDFWSIQKHLPKETQAYIPRWMAMVYLMNFKNDFSIESSDLGFPTEAEYTVNVTTEMSLMDLSETTDVPVKDILYLNPLLVGDKIPAKVGGYRLLIPKRNS